MTEPRGKRSKKLTDRGEYRSFYTGTIDDVAFRQISGDAFKLYFCLRQSLGAAGIGILRRLVLAEQLAIAPDELESLLIELTTPPEGQRSGWIVREDNAIWIVDG